MLKITDKRTNVTMLFKSMGDACIHIKANGGFKNFKVGKPYVEDYDRKPSTERQQSAVAFTQEVFYFMGMKDRPFTGSIKSFKDCNDYLFIYLDVAKRLFKDNKADILEKKRIHDEILQALYEEEEYEFNLQESFGSYDPMDEYYK